MCSVLCPSVLCFCNKDVWDKAGTHRCGQDSPHLKDPIALPPLVNGQACISGSLDAGLWLSLSCPKEMPWVNPWRLLPREDAGQWNELSAVKSIVYTVRMVLEEMRQEVGGCYSLTVKYPGRLTCWRLDFSCWCHWGGGGGKIFRRWSLDRRSMSLGSCLFRSSGDLGPFLSLFLGHHEVGSSPYHVFLLWCTELPQAPRLQS